MSQHRLPLWRIGRIALTLVAFVSIQPTLRTRCLGQSVLPTAVERQSLITPEEQAELQQTLRRHMPVVEALSQTVKAVAKLTTPAVVHIETDIESRMQHVEEAGSGVVILLGDKYYVLTNRHVVRNSTPSDIKINLADGRQIHPTQVWRDPGTDVAVLSVASPGLVAAPIGDSDEMEIGDFVLAVGSPFGLSQSDTFGIISAKGRRKLELGHSRVPFQDFLQTDAAINPGNSGGPLVNMRGQIIGINTAIASSSGGNEGIGFSIPINMVMIVGRQLIEHGKVARAFVGVNLDGNFGPIMAAEAGLPCPMGARVTAITKGAPAEAADVRVGDIILRFNGVEIEDDAHLMNLVGLTELGKTVPLVILRDRKLITIDITVGDRARFETDAKE